jgi:hypothetical protein
MMNCEGIWRKRSWPNFKVISRQSPGGTEKSHENPQSGGPVSRPRFEPGASGIRSRSEPLDHDVPSFVGKQSLIRNSEKRKAPKTESFSMEVDSNLNTTVTMTTMTTLMYPLLQDPQARCNVPLLHVRVYTQAYSLVWACLCLKFYWMFYLKIKSTLVILWSIFIPLKINSAMNNIYQLVLISCAILSLSSWPLTPLTTTPKSEKFRFPKRVWSQGFRYTRASTAQV